MGLSCPPSLFVLVFREMQHQNLPTTTINKKDHNDHSDLPIWYATPITMVPVTDPEDGDPVKKKKKRDIGSRQSEHLGNNSMAETTMQYASSGSIVPWKATKRPPGCGAQQHHTNHRGMASPPIRVQSLSQARYRNLPICVDLHLSDQAFSPVVLGLIDRSLVSHRT